MKSFFLLNTYSRLNTKKRSELFFSLVILLSTVLVPFQGISQTVTGQNVTSVEYNGSEEGSFRQLTETTWAEYKIDNSTVIHDTFTEIRRDEAAVYLVKSDGASIRIDLSRNRIFYNNSYLYNIRKADATPLAEGQNQQITFVLSNPAYDFKVYQASSHNPERKFMGNLVGAAPLVITATVGDVFTFEAANGQGQIAPYTVSQLGVTAYLEANAKATGLVPLIQTANLYSYDIFDIDPVYIDYDGRTVIPDSQGKKGGMRSRIFEDYKSTDLDYQTVHNSNGEYITPAGFLGTFRNKSWSNETTDVIAGTANFKQSLAADISVSLGLDKLGKATNSASFFNSTSTTTSYEHVYAYSKRRANIYSVSVTRTKAKLSEAFVGAVTNLPVPSNMPNSLEQARSNASFAAYRNFIAEWGTHYASTVDYGGIMVTSMEFTEDSYAELLKKGGSIRQDIEATIKGVSIGRNAGGSIEQSLAQKNITSYKRFQHFYSGGSGSPDTWDVNSSNVQPIGIELKRISDLLEPGVFRQRLPHLELDRRRQMLIYALHDYIGSSEDDGSSLRPKHFRLSNVSMRVLVSSEGNGAEIYGFIKAQVGQTTPKSSGRFIITQPMKEQVFWDTRNSAVPELGSTGYYQRFPGVLDFTVSQRGGSFDHLKNLSVLLTADLREEDDGRDYWNNISNDDYIGIMACSKVSLENVTSSPQPIQIEFKNRNWGADDGGWHIVIQAMIAEVDGTLVN